MWVIVGPKFTGSIDSKMMLVIPFYWTDGHIGLTHFVHSSGVHGIQTNGPTTAYATANDSGRIAARFGSVSVLRSSR